MKKAEAELRLAEAQAEWIRIVTKEGMAAALPLKAEIDALRRFLRRLNRPSTAPQAPTPVRHWANIGEVIKAMRRDARLGPYLLFWDDEALEARYGAPRDTCHRARQLVVKQIDFRLHARGAATPSKESAVPSFKRADDETAGQELQSRPSG